MLTKNKAIQEERRYSEARRLYKLFRMIRDTLYNKVLFEQKPE